MTPPTTDRDDEIPADEIPADEQVLDEWDESVEETVGRGPPDVLLDVPNLSVDEITLEVADLRAHVALRAEVLDLLKLGVGADVELGRVSLKITGVQAQALLKVRLDRIAQIIDRVLTTVDRNPQILERLVRALEPTLAEVGTAVERVGTGVGQAADEVGRGAGTAVEEVGRAAGTAVEEGGTGAGEAVPRHRTPRAGATSPSRRKADRGTAPEGSALERRRERRS
jgi:hypothetical protein